MPLQIMITLSKFPIQDLHLMRLQIRFNNKKVNNTNNNNLCRDTKFNHSFIYSYLSIIIRDNTNCLFVFCQGIVSPSLWLIL